MNTLKATFITAIAAILFSQNLSAQCQTWNGLPNMDELVGQHSVYREFVKNEAWDDAFDSWETVYTECPAADGKRDFHYSDGIKIYKAKFAAETDEAKKKEYSDLILRMYDEMITCYESGAISIKCNGDAQTCIDERISARLAQKGYDMYYALRASYGPTIDALKTSLDKGGNNTQYTVIVPYAKIAVYQFLKEKLTKEETREVHDRLLELCDYNIEAKGKYAQYYDQAKANVLSEFKKIQYQIFDCAYFKEQWLPDYENNKDDPAYAKDLYNKLKARGCDIEGGDLIMEELKDKWQEYAAEENARIQAEFEANNPALLAKKAYDAGDFQGAVDKYQEAINTETDDIKKAGYYYSKASILFRKMKNLQSGRSEARKAAQLRPDWGRPYALIGDMYATSAKRCGDSWNNSLAIIAAYDKYIRAKGLELSEQEAESVQTKIGRYRGYFPQKTEGFMKGIKEGTSLKVGCWIGESVKVRYSS